MFFNQARWMLIPFFLLIFVVAGCSSHSIVEPLTLFKNGQAQAVIVIPEHPSPPQRFAADELKLYLDRITGGDFTITNELPTDLQQRAILLGDSPATRTAGVQVDSLARDAFVIRSTGNRIIIAGKDDKSDKSEILFHLLDKDAPDKKSLKDGMYMAYHSSRWDFDRGTLNGVYRFLETVGVRWFMPGVKGEVVPSISELIVPSLDIEESPHYELAVIGSTGWPTKHAKDKSGILPEYEELGWSAAQNRLWLLRMRLPSKWIGFNHRSPRHKWEKRFGEVHPEYFAMLSDGKRDLLPVTGRTGHLCFSDEGMFQQTLLDIEAYFGGKSAEEAGVPVRVDRPYSNNKGWDSHVSYGNTFSLLPHDSYRACHCPNCEPLNREDLPNWAKYSAPVWLFVDRVAKSIKQKYPDHFVTCLAYSSYTDIPDQLKSLPENVIVGVCPQLLVRVHNTVNPDNFAKYIDLVKRWDAMNSQPVIIWSHYLYRNRQPRHFGVPMILPHHQAKLFSSLAPFSKWMYMQMDMDDLMMEQLNRYVMCRLSWEPTLDVDELLADYYDHFYGPAAELMGQLFADIEQRCMEIAGNSSGRVDIWETGFPPERLQQYRAWVEAAAKITKNTPYYEPVMLIDHYLLSTMEAGYSDYDNNVKQVAKDKSANITIRTMRSPIKIDGILDDEAWKSSGVVKFKNNVDHKPTLWHTKLQLLRSPEDLYFAFSCYRPGVEKILSEKKSLGYVEVFLDPNHDQDSYYQFLVDIASAEVQAQLWFPGGGELALAWISEAEVAVSHKDNVSFVEIRIPRSAVQDGLKVPTGKPWGANFCRTFENDGAPRPQDRFSCFSPLLTGNFHQPDLFGHIFFQK